MKVFVMGKQEEDVELPPMEPTVYDYYFEKIRISKEALDQASKYVPREVWEKRGIQSWLEWRGQQAFDLLKVGEHSVILGRLKYVFEPDPKGKIPVLKTVIIQPA